MKKTGMIVLSVILVAMVLTACGGTENSSEFVGNYKLLSISIMGEEIATPDGEKPNLIIEIHEDGTVKMKEDEIEEDAHFGTWESADKGIIINDDDSSKNMKMSKAEDGLYQIELYEEEGMTTIFLLEKLEQ